MFRRFSEYCRTSRRSGSTVRDGSLLHSLHLYRVEATPVGIPIATASFLARPDSPPAETPRSTDCALDQAPQPHEAGGGPRHEGIESVAGRKAPAPPVREEGGAAAPSAAIATSNVVKPKWALTEEKAEELEEQEARPSLEIEPCMTRGCSSLPNRGPLSSARVHGRSSHLSWILKAADLVNFASGLDYESYIDDLEVHAPLEPTGPHLVCTMQFGYQVRQALSVIKEQLIRLVLHAHAWCRQRKVFFQTAVGAHRPAKGPGASCGAGRGWIVD